MGLPAILVPLPNAIDDHQMANARYLSESGAGFILPQKELNADNLLELINKAKQQLDKMALAAKQCARMDATEVVANVCIREAKAMIASASQNLTVISAISQTYILSVSAALGCAVLRKCYLTWAISYQVRTLRKAQSLNGWSI